MPQELIDRDYCRALYATRCKPKSMNDTHKIPAIKELYEDMTFDSYVQDYIHTLQEKPQKHFKRVQDLNTVKIYQQHKK